MSGPPSLIGEGLINFMMELAETAPAGNLVEIGVYKGGSAWFLAKVAREQGRKLHLFDTFEGMPFALEEDNHKVGDFADVDVGDVMEAIPDAQFHVGVFPLTWPENMPPVAFAHVDCDQYQSVRDSIDFLLPVMVPGGAILFDDYKCTWGCTKAVDETFGDRVLPTTANRGWVRV